jgi:hypothetical protein
VAEHAALIVVVNPSQFKVISQPMKKADKNDAELLALYLERGLLPKVRMKGRNQRNMAHLAQTRSAGQAADRVLPLPFAPILAAEARVLVGSCPLWGHALSRCSTRSIDRNFKDPTIASGFAIKSIKHNIFNGIRISA